MVVLPFDAATRDLDRARVRRGRGAGRIGRRLLRGGIRLPLRRARRGDAALLQTLCAARGVPCEIVGCLADGAEKISSTRIRGLIASGDVAGAAALLGRPFAFSGEVIHGKALGRTLGFPTMNVPVPRELVLPPAGVYVCRALVAGAWRRAVCNIAHGDRPLCEVHAFNYGGDAYGLTIRVEFLDFVRGMRRFPSLEALTRQVECDKKLRLIGSLHGEAAFSLIFCGSFHYCGISRKMVS